MGLINQFRDLWQPLGVNQKISLVLASGLVAIAMIAMVVWADAFVEVELIYGTAVLYEMKGSIHVGAGVGVESESAGIPAVAFFSGDYFGLESAHSRSEG